MTKNLEEQIIILNDWMAENEPDIYWRGEGEDTASAILRVIEKYRKASPPVITAHAATVQFPCAKCGLTNHTAFTMGGVDVYQCAKCNSIKAGV